MLDLLGVSPQLRVLIEESDGPIALTRSTYPSDFPNFPPTMVEAEPQFDMPWPLISPTAVAGERWSVVPNALEFGVSERDLTSKDASAIWSLSVDNGEGLAYLGMDLSSVLTNWSLSSYIDDSNELRLTPTQIRLLVLGVSLLLVMLLVSIGMALWAVESRDERDVLVAVGASPSTLARIAAWRAGGLTFGAMLIAVPMGLVVSWAITRAAHGSIAVPWLLAALLLFAVPAIIGVGALACSGLAHKIRPVRMSTLTAD